MGMTAQEEVAFSALAECVTATGKALAKIVGVLGEELPELKPRLSAVMEELVLELSAAALLLPQTEPGPT